MFYQLPPVVAIVIQMTIMVMSFCLGVFVLKWCNLNQAGKTRTLVVEGTLLSLLLGFTFNSAFDRYTSRKKVFSEEVNQVSMIHGLTRFYPPEERGRIRQMVLDYVAHRISYFDAGGDEQRIADELGMADSSSHVLLEETARLAHSPDNIVVSMQIATVLDRLLSLSVTRESLRRSRVPLSVLRLLLLISTLVSFLHGTNSGFNTSDWLTVLGFCLLIGMTLYLIIDMDTARSGLISLQEEQQRFKQLYQYLLTHS